MLHSPTGILFDTSILIAGERRRESVEEILFPFRNKYGKIAVGLSTISVVELTHGIYRARNAEDSFRRRTFVSKAFRDLLVYPVSLEIAPASRTN